MQRQTIRRQSVPNKTNNKNVKVTSSTPTSVRGNNINTNINNFNQNRNKSGIGKTTDNNAIGSSRTPRLENSMELGKDNEEEEEEEETGKITMTMTFDVDNDNDDEAGGINKNVSTPLRGNTNTSATTTTAEIQSKGRSSSQGVQDRLWEKEQLHEINLRVDNIFNVFGNKLGAKGESMQTEILEEMHNQQTKIIKEITEEFLEKERKKADELTDIKAENCDLKDRNSELNSELQTSQTAIELLRADLTKAKKEKEDAIREKAKAAADAQNLKDALETQLKMLQGDTQSLFEPDNTSSATIKENLERKFTARLAELLQDRDDQHNKLKEQLENAFEKKIKELEVDYNHKIVELNNRDEAQTKALQDLHNETLKFKQERDQAMNELESKKHIYEMAEEELRRQRDNTNEELKRAKDKLEQTQKEQRDTNNLYFDLEKMNLHLRTEIEALKRKLDAFEEQHKIETPVRPAKRRRTDSVLMQPKVLKSVQGPLIEAHTSFPLECVTIQYEGDWTGFELQNQWNKAVVLKGWNLTNGDRSARIQLPEKILNPKEIIRVCLTENKKEASDLLWQGLDIRGKDSQELWAEDDLGFQHKIATFPLPPTTTGFRTDSCLVM